MDSAAKELDDEAFLYRNLKPGERKRTGAWSDDEKAKFVKRLAEFPIDGTNWGAFSAEIEGRCGYQCKKFYKLLVDRGEVKPVTMKRRAKWSPRMSQPWKTVEGSTGVIRFPEEPPEVVREQSRETPRFEYQVSRIMRMNVDNPLNFLLFSFPVENEKRARFMNVVRNKLAHNVNQREVDALVNDYFALASTTDTARERITNDVVARVLSERI